MRLPTVRTSDVPKKARFEFSPEITEFEMRNVENYKGLSHKHTTRCAPNIDENGLCHITKHEVMFYNLKKAYVVFITF